MIQLVAEPVSREASSFLSCPSFGIFPSKYPESLCVDFTSLQEQQKQKFGNAGKK